MKETNRPLLVVEDDTGLQSQLRWCFDDYDVVITGDREAAIAQLRRHQPWVVLLDLGLPPDPGGVTEGFATLSEILVISPPISRPCCWAPVALAKRLLPGHCTS